MRSRDVRATAAGLLFIAATATSLVATAFRGSLLTGPGFLAAAALHQNRLLAAALFQLLAAFTSAPERFADPPTRAPLAGRRARACTFAEAVISCGCLFAPDTALEPQKPFDCRHRVIKAAVMTSRISHTSFDAVDAYAQSVFWSQVLDFIEDPDDPNMPGHQECLITSRDRSQLLLFITVPDGKTVKNRLLDLTPADRTREQEAERILALGATQLADHRRPDGSGWITLADPAGNEFCILSREPADSGATT